MKRSTQVLIVGAGPVGLMLACLLRRMNVECLVVDRDHGVDPRPRAITLHAPTIELFSDLGLLDSLLGVSIPLERISFHAPGDRVFEGRLDGWDSVVDGYLNSPQPLYQTVLQDEALRLGAAAVYGAKLTGLRQHPGGVQAEMTGAGTEHLVDAAYLVGADGASSAVRRLVGVEMLGDGPVRSYVLMEGDPVQAPPSGETGLYVGGSGMVTLSPLPQGKVRVAGPAREGLRLHRDQQLTAGAVAGMIGDLGFGELLRLASVDRVSHYSVVERIADRLVHGRVFLAGDAAHLNAPAGGQGVNLGFADAAALAWRLASAVDSHDPDLFRSYDSERRYAAGHTIGQANVFPIVQAIRGATSQSADQRIQRELDARAAAWTQLHTPTIANEDCSLSVLGRRIGHHALPSRRARKVPVSSAFSIIRRASATLHRTSPCTGTTRLALAAGHLPLPKDLDLAGATQVWVDAWPLPDGAAKHEWPVQAPDALLVGPDRVVRGFLKQTPHSSDAADTAVTTTLLEEKHMTFPAMPKAVADFYRGSQLPDADIWASAFAENGLFHDPVGSEPIAGREAIRAKLEAVIPKFPDFYGLTPISAHTVAGRTAVSWTGAVVARNGNPVNWAGITVFTLDEDGLIADASAYFNHDVFAAQLNGTALLAGTSLAGSSH